MTKVVLDTNFLVDCAKFKIDYMTELRRILDGRFTVRVIDKTINELKKIMTSGKSKASAKLALAILRHNDIKTVKTKKKLIVDELILDLADETWIVGTQDADLKRKLRQIKVPRLVVRQKRYLAVIGT